MKLNKIFLLSFFFSTLFCQSGIDESLTIQDILIKETDNNFITHISDYFCNDKYIFLTDQNDIFKCDFEGNIVDKIHSKGQGPGEFGRLGKLLLNNNKIYIEDKGNHKIIIMDLNFKLIDEIRLVHIEPIQNWEIVNNKYLITFSFAAAGKPVIIYDLDKKEMIKKLGEPSKLQFRYKTFDIGGGLIILENHIYFIHSQLYKIFKYNFDSRLISVFEPNPSHFKTIHKKPDPVNIFNSDYSIIQNILNIKNNLYVYSMPPSQNGKPRKAIVDKISLKGELIEENLPAKYLVQAKQVSPTRFIKVVDYRPKFGPDSPKSQIKFRIMDLK